MTLTRGRTTNSAVTALDDRLMDLGGLVVNSDGTPRVGVMGGANPSIVSTTANTGPATVNVAAAQFACSRGVADGVTHPNNDGTVSVALGSAPGSNSLITVIWVKQNDNTAGDANSNPVFGATDGSAAASPTKPAIPTGATELATLRRYAGTTSSNGGSNVLTNTYNMTAKRGGVCYFRTAAERDAWTNPVDGQLGFVIALEAMYQYIAGAPTPGWYHVGGGPEINGISFGGLWQQSASGGAAGFRKHSGLIVGSGSIQNNTTVSVALGTEYIIGTIPDASFRPDVDRYFATGTNSNGDAATIRVAANGDIGWRCNATATWTGAGSLRIDLGGIIFTQKGLA